MLLNLLSRTDRERESVVCNTLTSVPIWQGKWQHKPTLSDNSSKRGSVCTSPYPKGTFSFVCPLSTALCCAAWPITSVQSLCVATDTMRTAAAYLGASLSLYGVPSRGFLPAGRPTLAPSRAAVGTGHGGTSARYGTQHATAAVQATGRLGLLRWSTSVGSLVSCHGKL